MTKSHRLFFALIPNAQVRHEVRAIQERLQNAGRAIRPEQFHVTLAFLGNQPGKLIAPLKSLAARLDFPRCTMQLDQLGRFGRAGVLWLGASAIPPALQAFQKELAAQLESAGIDFDRKEWKPHLTLYRKLRKPSVNITTEPVSWQINSFELIESVGVKNGVRYDSLGRWPGS